MNLKSKIDRRAFVLAAGAGVAATGCTTTPSALSAEEACVAPGSGATFVLVHGSWTSAYSYADLDHRLTARGHRIYRPALSGWGPRAHLARPETNIDTNIDDVCGLIAFEDLSDIVLVGHSYGGMVITGVADRMPERIASIVYLDAFLPEDGMSIADYAGDDWRAICEGVLARGEFLLPLPEFLAPEGAEVDPKLTPVPVRQQLQRIALTGAHERVPRKVYVRATENPAAYFEAAYQSVIDDPAWTTYAVPTGHDVYLEAPERTVEILEAAV